MTCTVEGCERPADWEQGGRRGYCSPHYDRWLLHGDVQAHIPLRPAYDEAVPPPPPLPETVDEVAVARAVAGEPPPFLSAVERRFAVWQLSALGLPTSVIAERVGCTLRTVVRIRARLRSFSSEAQAS